MVIEGTEAILELIRLMPGSKGLPVNAGRAEGACRPVESSELYWLGCPGTPSCKAGARRSLTEMENREADPKGFCRSRNDPRVVFHCQQILMRKHL